ncbi:hypothetical protein F383_04004 [Gossypium arboreum]|uniref:Uncharacterized protein n=1 Tax=Gossypium arboreum TaxID=29729 RepID=A0A0B0P5Z5_GOSAR|nr:hypothetical protein F383_04004 [Gossypium arboreum]
MFILVHEKFDEVILAFVSLIVKKD